MGEELPLIEFTFINPVVEVFGSSNKKSRQPGGWWLLRNLITINTTTRFPLLLNSGGALK